jgi:predicted CoA-substrate-specific enzyme activase
MPLISSSNTILGIDIGSVAVSLVQSDLNGNILSTTYAFHHGRIRETLMKLQKDIDLSVVRGIGTVAKNHFNPENVKYFDTQIAIIAAAKKLFPELASIMVVGAEKFQLINFDRAGNYEHTATNTSCAVGTGSFLDQQAKRLNLEDVRDLCNIAIQNTGEIPDIASRCAVFAKTDLIHAQQEGYSLSAICDSLCKGLAKNIVDTLYSDDKPRCPILFAGGVSRNNAVKKHLESLLGTELLHHDFGHILPAYGACLLFIKENKGFQYDGIISITNYFTSQDIGKKYFHNPLSLTLTRYPSFSSEESYEFKPVQTMHRDRIQVDLYKKFTEGSTLRVYAGIDIGSTSTKAILCDERNEPVAGFYTYTAGRPIPATQAIFEAISDIQVRKRARFEIIGAGTTGSGRKFIGKILNADLIIDEITAHARAAYELNPETDTIIEIGGQDAKFTLMKNGMVTFAQMNSVCAAGTGSFIEEQARKLGISLTDYSKRAEGASAPLASDRCTVFMERDINNYLNKGYSVEEILAAVLHSVRENYLKKVAVEATIGNNICFQGATAKNKALVAAFENKLGKEIYVSKFCHLTGALGLTYILAGELKTKSRFRGLDVYNQEIPVKTEICQMCNNNCRIRIAEVSGEKVAYGFLCGRDYDTKKYIDRNKSGFDLIKERRNHFHFPKKRSYKFPIKIGIPASLHMFDEISLWQRFFDNLSVETITSENFENPVKTGKRIAGAEFCAPMEAMYGHISWLAERSDYIFLPVYLEARDKEFEAERNYCYYTQYSPVVVSGSSYPGLAKKYIVPLLNYSAGIKAVKKELFKSFQPILGSSITNEELSDAFEDALYFYNRKKETLKQIFDQDFSKFQDISVVLVGRPYLVLSPHMNKGIPDIFGGMGIRVCFQDMLLYNHQDYSDIDYLLKVFPWYYAANILEAAKVSAVKKNLYPVLVTAFKCAPDSFLIDYFKKIMDAHQKPYLILQIDDHDSNVGYETRIEAGIRSFRNHAAIDNQKVKTMLPLITSPEKSIWARKILIFPNWDQLVAPMLVANLKKEGLDARLLEPDDEITRKSMVHNTGQCLPINIITQEFIEFVRKNNLDPADTMLWMVETKLTCNIRLYPYYIKDLLDKYGEGMEKALIYSGDVSHLDISLKACLNAYLIYMIGGLIRRLGCKIRPYETTKGETDKTIAESIKIMTKAFLGRASAENSLVQALSLFEKIKYNPVQRPRVAIFGDLYVRDNDVLNQDLIHVIEDSGGEIITTPYHEYVKLTVQNGLRRMAVRGENLEALGLKAMLAGIQLMDKTYYKHFRKFLGDPPSIRTSKYEKKLELFNIKNLHSGESYDNILKIFFLIDNYPDISLFLQTNPAFCCPSLITEAMKNQIYRITGIPVVTITYDGTSDFKNDIIVPYLKLATKREPVKNKQPRQKPWKILGTIKIPTIS